VLSAGFRIPKAFRVETRDDYQKWPTLGPFFKYYSSGNQMSANN
jgi:hypothetical protein